MPPRGTATGRHPHRRGCQRPGARARRHLDPLRLRLGHTVGAPPSEGTLAVAGPDALLLTSPVELVGENMHTVAEFEVAPGERVPFVLTWYPSNEDLPERVDAEQALNEHRGVLGGLVGRLPHEGPHRDALVRSLVTLKALTYAPTGGIVAAPTTSLPEAIGGVRNWDYRFCWVRDATMTLLSLVRAGYDDEARAWRDWLLRAIAGSPDGPQSLYGIAGERRLAEVELPWLDGLRGLEAGAGRERRRRPAPARRVRGDPGRALPGALGRAATVGRRLGAQPAVARAAREGLARARRGDLGGARPAPAVHALEGDVLGRVRPRRALRRGARARGASRALAGAAGRGSRRRLPRGVPRGARRVHPVLRLGPRSTPASC